MTKEELKQEAEKWLRKFLLCNDCKRKCHCIELNAYCEEQVLKAYIDSAEPREKRIAELEEKISVLLSCKNCPENKGGLICQKEYEDKCLTQKIQFIKELQQENAELKDEWQKQVQKANDEGYARTLQTIQLNKAKEIISEWEDSFCCSADYLYLGNKGKELRSKSQKFLNSEVVK